MPNALDHLEAIPHSLGVPPQFIHLQHCERRLVHHW
jgi:hypothetical protein